MQKKTIFALITMAFSSAAFAGPDCTSESQDKWMDILDMQKKIINDYGYAINKFKTTDGNCYEIYGYENIDSQWEKVEIYFHPIDGSIVKKK